jgi:uncharacterized membrane protein YesL
MLSALAAFWELFKQAFLLTVSLMGTSPLAILVYIVVVPLILLGRRLYKEGSRGAPTMISEGINDTVIITATIWALLLFFNLLYTLPHQINSQAEAINSPAVPFPIKLSNLLTCVHHISHQRLRQVLCWFLPAPLLRRIHGISSLCIRAKKRSSLST